MLWRHTCGLFKKKRDCGQEANLSKECDWLLAHGVRITDVRFDDLLEGLLPPLRDTNTNFFGLFKSSFSFVSDSLYGLADNLLLNSSAWTELQTLNANRFVTYKTMEAESNAAAGVPLKKKKRKKKHAGIH